jgi:hypothetical protein
MIRVFLCTQESTCTPTIAQGSLACSPTVPADRSRWSALGPCPMSATIKASESGIAIRSGQLKYNYVEFRIELTQPPKQVADGHIALARVVSDDAEADLPSAIRTIFAGGTAGSKAVGAAAAGDRLHVLGIPRVNLNAISFLVSQHGTTQFTTRLPYEMIIVGVYPD